MTDIPEPAGTACFLDGVNFNRAKQILGIEKINWTGFRNVLSGSICTTGRLVGKPIVTVNPDCMNGLGKILLRSGFFPLAVRSHGSHDDRVLIDRIEQVQRAQVAEIIIVSCDSDFIPILLEKANQGIRVVWLVSETRSDNGASQISDQLKNMFRQKRFFYTTLERFRVQIELRQRDEHRIGGRSRRSGIWQTAQR